jgi:hypothetical protein
VNALRALLKSETERGPDFLRLANALSVSARQPPSALGMAEPPPIP